jgi:hypothetical protein
MYQEYKANLKFVRQGNEKAQKVVKEKLAATKQSAEPAKKAAKKAVLHKRHNPYRYLFLAVSSSVSLIEFFVLLLLK